MLDMLPCGSVRTLCKFIYKQSSSRHLNEEPPSNKCILCTLIVGLIAGICLAQFFETPEIKTSFSSYKKTVEHQNSYESKNYNSTIADKLKKEVRILCWVMTSPKNHKERAVHVKRTWGKRCNILLFMSSEEDEELPTVKLNVTEGRKNLWKKVKEAFKYVYKHHYNDADWFYKADDDTYAVVENLRYMLYPYNPQTRIYFGCKFKPYVKQGYMSGGAGYVLSREALRQLVEKGIGNPKICLPGTVENEDIELGRCMANLNVTAGDSRDSTGRGRMFVGGPGYHLIPPKFDKTFWYWSYKYYNNDDGLDCCSDLAISWHYIYHYLMYKMDYLIYDLKIYGLLQTPEALPAKLKVGELLPEPIDQPADTNEDSVDDEDRFANATTSEDLKNATISSHKENIADIEIRNLTLGE